MTTAQISPKVEAMIARWVEESAIKESIHATPNPTKQYIITIDANGVYGDPTEFVGTLIELNQKFKPIISKYNHYPQWKRFYHDINGLVEMLNIRQNIRMKRNLKTKLRGEWTGHELTTH